MSTLLTTRSDKSTIEKAITRVACVLVFLLILSGCTSRNGTSKDVKPREIFKSDTTKQVTAAPNSDTTLKLDFFDTVPGTIRGCGEYFTYDTSKFEQGSYIFLSDLTEFAVIKINGKDFYLNRDTTESKVIDDESYIAVYKGQGYRAILKIKQTKAYDEGGFYFGTLQVIGNKIKATFKVHGEAGC